VAAACKGTTYDPAQALFLVGVVDCMEGRVANATITMNPAGTLCYFAGSPPTISSTAMTTDINGLAIAFNVNPATTTVTAQGMGGVQFRALTIAAIQGGALTQVAVQP